MKLSEPRDKTILDETDIEDWTGLELLTFEWNEPSWILRDLPPVVIRTRKSIITLLTKEFTQLEVENEALRSNQSFASNCLTQLLDDETLEHPYRDTVQRALDALLTGVDDG